MDKATPLHSHLRHSNSSSSSQNKQAKTILPLHKQSYSYQRQPSDISQRSSSNSPPSYRRTTHRYNSAGSNSNTGSNNSYATNMMNDDTGDNNNVSLPTWSANPQSPVDDTNTAGGGGGGGGGGSARNSPTSHLPHHQIYNSQYSGSPNSERTMVSLSNMFTSRRAGGRVCCSWTTLFYSILLGMGMTVALQSRGSLTESMEHLSQLMHNGHVLQGKLLDAEKGIKLLQREVSAYDIMQQQHEQQQQQGSLSSHPNNPTGTDGGGHPHNEIHNQALEEMQQLDRRLQDSRKKAENLKHQVQALSKKEALEKYGNHVHKVEIELAFPDRREGPTKFVIELAPLELMPHSVHFFLEMVHSGLLDGCSFILNALHVLKAAPLPYDGSSAANKARAFTRMGLESVAFKEYAPSYPHEQYTVGFAADGSPSFYINTEDNSEIHLGDPCFGKIVEGFDTVKRLEASPTRNGIWFEQRIGIHRATVLM